MKTLLLIAVTGLTACTTEYPIMGTISYRDPSSGAKGGLTFTPGESPKAYVKVPITDPETGATVGYVDLNSTK